MDIFMGRDPKRQRLCMGDGDDCEDDDEDDDDSDFGFDSSPNLAIDMIGDTSQMNDEPDDNLDPWMKAALTLSASIDEVSAMIERKAESYVCSIDTLNICFNNQFAAVQSMTNSDRSILETTVASFAAGMAKQIESLRKTVVVEGDHPFITDNNVNADHASSHRWTSGQIGHRVGIASCLMQRLKSEIMEPMTSLQSQREKIMSKNDKYRGDEALEIAQNPLRLFRLEIEASLHRPLPPAPWEVGDHDAEKDRMERNQEEEEFLNVYFDGKKVLLQGDNLTKDSVINNMSPPPSVMQLMDLPNPSQEITRQEMTQQVIPNRQPIPRRNTPPLPYEDEGEHMVQLQRESAALLATYQHSDLEGVQKVERSMVEITSLLSRFTDLIIEQQDSVLTIHDQALKSKDNVDKGQDQLVDAAKRGEKSNHPMATFIFSMAILLLLFNWITP